MLMTPLCRPSRLSGLLSVVRSRRVHATQNHRRTVRHTTACDCVPLPRDTGVHGLLARGGLALPADRVPLRGLGAATRAAARRREHEGGRPGRGDRRRTHHHHRSAPSLGGRRDGGGGGSNRRCGRAGETRGERVVVVPPCVCRIGETETPFGSFFFLLFAGQVCIWRCIFFVVYFGRQGRAELFSGCGWIFCRGRDSTTTRGRYAVNAGRRSFVVASAVGAAAPAGDVLIGA